MVSLRRFLVRAPEPPLSSLPRPAKPLCIIGDLHGTLHLLEQMLALIAAQPGAGEVRVILVGDLMDRGPDSAGVLARVMALTAADPERVICLMGNHERMLLDALQAPQRALPRWLLHGGAETLASLGLRARGVEVATLAKALRDALPAGAEAWLQARPLFWQEGGLGVVHAAADPARALPDQPETALLWGHRRFGQVRRADGLWIAHGHSIVERPVAQGGTIAVDTGAWTSGRLSAAWLDQDGLRFLEVQERQSPAEGTHRRTLL